MYQTIDSYLKLYDVKMTAEEFCTKYKQEILDAHDLYEQLCGVQNKPHICKE